ncbi:hypothetical protein M4D79_22075 [Mycolicibacterium novocastrense]|nr:hypothetical protein M4D79_22075 [Mycolicibacterium novocastrense]
MTIFVGDIGHLLGEAVHPLHLVDVGLNVVDLLQHPGRQVLVVFLGQFLAGALHADQERD